MFSDGGGADYKGDARGCDTAGGGHQGAAASHVQGQGFQGAAWAGHDQSTDGVYSYWYLVV